jgi:hypothetical protein
MIVGGILKFHNGGESKFLSVASLVYACIAVRVTDLYKRSDVVVGDRAPVKADELQIKIPGKLEADE